MIWVIKSDTLLLGDVFEKFRNKYIKIYELDPAPFLSGPGLGWEPCFKNTDIRWDLLTDVDMLFMVERELEDQCVMPCIDIQK